MQKTVLILCFAGLSLQSFSQNENLLAFEKQRVNITKKSMMVLGGWSAVNMITSAFATKTNNAEMRYFHQMNVLWNGINIGIAALGYLGAGFENIKNPALSSVLKHQNGNEKTYMLNLGLDVAYITSGFYLKEKSKSEREPAKLTGYGNVVLFQGSFLLLFDTFMYFLHHNHGKQLNKLLDKVKLNGGPGALSLTYKF